MSARAPIALLVSLLLLGPPAPARAGGLEVDGERILELQLDDGGTLNNALVVYPSANDWYFPLGETADSLGLAIKVSAALSKASGFVIRESRTFELDVRQCRVITGGQHQNYPCDKVQIYQDEIYVHQDLLQKWFPIHLNVNPYRSQATVTPLEPLPAQLRRQREQLAERSKGMKFGYDPGYPLEPIPNRALSVPLIDDQLSVTRGSSSTSPWSLFNTIQAGAEVLGLETSALLAHDQKKVQTSRLTFGKRDADGGLFGPLDARDVSAFDIVTPLMPLISNGEMGRGFTISSFPLNQPYAFDKHDFQGALPSGWEVLLYRNEVLIDRQVSNGSGTYFFRNVALFYGLNRFRLTFFGPYGQRRDEYHTLNVSPDLLQPDTGYYRLSYLQLDNTRQWATAQYTRNLSRNLTVNTNLFQDSAGRSYATVGASGMNERFLFSTNCAFATDGGKACEWGEQFGLEWLTVGAKYTRLFDFKSELFNNGNLVGNQTGQAELTASYLLPTQPNASTTLEAIRKTYSDIVDHTTFRHLIAFSAGRFYWNHRLTYDNTASSPFSGRWDLSFVHSLSRLNLGMEYEPSRLTLVDFEAQANLSEKYLLNTLISRRLADSASTTLQLTASRYFDAFALGATFASTDLQTFSVGLLLSFGLVPDTRSMTVSSVSRPVSQFGAVAVTVYKDLNHNHQLDPGEPTVPDIRVTVDQREVETPTNESGRILLPYLQPHTPVDIAISIDSLKDPFLKAIKKGVRVLPRIGALAHVDLPLEIVGEVDGAVEVEDHGERHGKRSAELELTGIDNKWTGKAKTDRDGYFLFDDVPAGRYRLKVKNGTATPAERIVTMPETGDFESGQNFLMKP